MLVVRPLTYTLKKNLKVYSFMFRRNIQLLLKDWLDTFQIIYIQLSII